MVYCLRGVVMVAGLDYEYRGTDEPNFGWVEFIGTGNWELELEFAGWMGVLVGLTSCKKLRLLCIAERMHILTFQSSFLHVVV